MKNIVSFLESIDSHHENFKTESKNIESLIKDIEFYESFIPNFFSCNGEAKGIKVMYESIRQNLDNEKTVTCIDVNKSSHIYNEYIEGMMTFIKDIDHLVITENCDEINSYKEKFEKAKDKDSIFIESLYDGRLNEKIDMPLSEAVSNIEFLIDFISQLKTIKENCSSLYEIVINNKQETKKELLNESVNMLFESVDNYCYSTIKNIINIYSNIDDKLNNVINESESNKSITFKLL